MSRPLKQLQSPSELSQDVICHLMCHLLHYPAAGSRLQQMLASHAMLLDSLASHRSFREGSLCQPSIFGFCKTYFCHSTGVGTYFLACVQVCKQPQSSPQGNTYWHRPTVQGNGCESIFHCMVECRLGSTTPWCPIPVQTACNSAVQCHCFPTMRIGCEHGQYLLVRSKFQLLGSWQTGALRFGAASGALVRLALACVKPARRLPLLNH